MKPRPNPLLHIAAAAGIALTGIAHAGLTLYSETGSYNINDNNTGFSLPDLNVTRGADGTGALYFKYTVTNPASNTDTENYYAGMSFFDGSTEHLGVGNGWGPWAYSAFSGGLTGGSIDLNSATPEPGQTYQLVRSTDITTFFFKINFNASANDNVTVWLNPNQAVAEGSQSSALTTTFTADANYNDLRLREGDSNPSAAGWTYSNIAIAGSFADLSSDTTIKAPETQVFTQDVALSAKSIFEWNLDGDDRTTRGTGGYDAVNVAGTLTGSNAAFKVILHDDAFTNPFWDTNQAWDDIFKANADGSGSAFTIAGLFSSITGAGITWDSGTSRGNVASEGYFTITGTSLNWTAVPEPTSALAGLLLAAGLLRRRRAVG